MSDTLDVLGTSQYATVGALGALAKGENPLEGAAEGIQNRASTRDWLEEMGAPGPVAFAGGMVGDLALDPTTYLPFVAAAKYGAKAVSRLRGIGGATVLRKASDVLATVDNSTVITADAVRTARHLKARNAYKQMLGTFAEHPELATPEVRKAAAEAARRASKTIGYGANPANPAEVLRLTGLMRGAAGEASTGAAKDLGDMWGWAAKSAGEAFRDIKRFGPFGAIFADTLDAAARRRTRLTAEWLSYHEKVYDPILKKMSRKELDQFVALVEGKELRAGKPQHLLDLVDRFKKDTDQIYDDLRKAGVREYNDWFTVQMRQWLAGDTTGELKEVLAELKRGSKLADILAQRPTMSMSLRMKLDQMVKEEFEIIFDDLTGAVAVTMPLQYVDGYFPRRISEKGIAWLRKMKGKNRQELMAAIGKDPSMKGLTPDEVEALASMSGLGHFRPGDITETFQLRRRAGAKIPDWFYDKDVRKGVRSWFESAGDRIGHASVFGGANQNYFAILDGVASSTDARYTRDSVRAIETAWDHFNGDMGSGGSRGFVRRINQITSGIWLGPRTALLQLTQLANPAAAFGVEKTLAATGLVMKDLAAGGDSDMLRAVQRSGALLPTADKVMDVGTGTGKIWETWHRIMGIRAMDRGARTISAVAASLHVQDLAKQLAKAGKVTPYLERQFGVLGLDAATLLKQTGELTDDQLMTAMRAGADYTQFASRTQDLPRMFHGVGGRFFLKFKSFTFQQANFLEKEIGSKLRNPKTFGEGARKALAYGATFGYLYSTLAKHLNMMAGKDTPTDDDVEYMTNLLLTGAVGVWGDAAASVFVKGNEALALGFIAGPNAAAVSKAMAGTGKAGGAATQGELDLSGFEPLVPAIARQPIKYGKYILEQ